VEDEMKILGGRHIFHNKFYTFDDRFSILMEEGVPGILLFFDWPTFPKK
jgi:hypothetical protein